MVVVIARIRTSYPPRPDWYDELYLQIEQDLDWPPRYAELLEEAGEHGFVFSVSEVNPIAADDDVVPSPDAAMSTGVSIMIEERSIERRVAQRGSASGSVPPARLSAAEIGVRRALLMSFGFRPGRPDVLSASDRRVARLDEDRRRRAGYLPHASEGIARGGLPESVWNHPRIVRLREESDQHPPTGYLGSPERRAESDRVVCAVWLRHADADSLVEWLLSSGSAAFMAFAKDRPDEERRRIETVLPDEIADSDRRSRA